MIQFRLQKCSLIAMTIKLVNVIPKMIKFKLICNIKTSLQYAAVGTFTLLYEMSKAVERFWRVQNIIFINDSFAIAGLENVIFFVKFNDRQIVK